MMRVLVYSCSALERGEARPDGFHSASPWRNEGAAPDNQELRVRLPGRRSCSKESHPF
jgi:hypothetical protein